MTAFDQFDPPAALAVPIPEELRKSMQEMQRQTEKTVANTIAEMTAATATDEEREWVSLHAARMLLTCAATLFVASGIEKQLFLDVVALLFDDAAAIYLGRMSADQTGSRQ
jgi:hypothetical protein